MDNDEKTSGLIREIVTMPLESIKQGDRVGVLCDFDGKIMRSFGYGKYIGETTAEQVMLDVDDYFQHPLVEYMSKEDISVPVIELDNGDTVYGFESWWHKGDVVEKLLNMVADDDIEVVEITIKQARQEMRERFSSEGESNE